MYKYVMGWENRVSLLLVGSSLLGSLVVIFMSLFYLVKEKNPCLNRKDFM
jgi:hypothetical protein